MAKPVKSKTKTPAAAEPPAVASMDDAEIRSLREKLGHAPMKWEPSKWLQTGIPDLNTVMGHRDLGIPYGRMIEISGQESTGKTSIALALAALGQREGAAVIWVSHENSWDDDWARIRGLDPSKVRVLLPYVGTFLEKGKDGKMRPEKKPRMSAAQELCSEAEQLVALYRKKHDRVIMVHDSIASMLSVGEAKAGLEGANLRTDQDLPKFLSRLMRRWVGMMQVYDCTTIFINQLRQSPQARPGSPAWYTPGGNAAKFYCHIRIRSRRVRGGRLRDAGKMVGVQGLLSNFKNKTGGMEGSEVGYKLLFKGPLEFISAKEATRAEREKESE